MDSNLTNSLDSTGFVSFLCSQSVDLDSSELPRFSSQCSNESSVKERRKWSPKEDVILTGAWLNTSKDPIVSNEQKAGAFWRRIQEYYNSSPLLLGKQPMELGQCKQRWQRLNDQVCKFVGCYDAALKDQSSGQNENDVMKAALDIFYNDYNFKFTLEHAWRELRHDQKWCSTLLAKDGGKEKRKDFVDVEGEDVVRPPGVKAAKAAKRRKGGKEEALDQLQSMLVLKEMLNKQQLLDCLLAKIEPLSEMENNLKSKLITDILGTN